MCFCVHLTAGSAGILHPHSVYIPLHHGHGVVHSAPQYPSHYLPYTKVRYHVLPKLLCIGTSANFCIHQKSRSKIKERVACILLTVLYLLIVFVATVLLVLIMHVISL